jgi:lipoprotein Spr
MTYRIWLIIPAIFLISACSYHPPSKHPPLAHHGYKTPVPVKRPKQSIRHKLLNQYSAWKGVPYRYGGLSKQGIDCSGFVFLTFKQQLDIHIPRTTAKQSQSGRSIDYRDIQTGDLLFFKTDVKVRHVGIYVGDQQFIHASTSQGVMLSDINNPYWQRHFWKAKRL